jgi:hypothetical protein
MALLRVVLVALPLVLWLAYSYVKRTRFQRFKNIPQLSPDLIWGHLKTIHNFQIKVGKDKHVGVLRLLKSSPLSMINI